MAENKTRKNDASVETFLAGVGEPRQTDCRAVLEMMQTATGESPAMWGTTIVGFGRYDYTYASGRSGSWFRTGFSSRKQALTLYIMPGFEAARTRVLAAGVGMA